MTNSLAEELHSQKQMTGYAYALAAYTFWGFAPIYFVYVSFAQPLEVLAHRVVWSVPLVAVLITVARQWPMLRDMSRRTYLTLMLCALLLTVNWLTFIYAVQAGHIVETSLGYFINPLVNILLGWTFLSERLRTWQWVAVGLAAAGVAGELITAGELPWLGLLLAFTFGFYGLLRKQLGIPSSVGLGVETVMVVPLALGYLIYISSSSVVPERSLSELSWLALGGVVTVLPLLWFAAAAIRIPLTTLGFFQYLAPSVSLMIAIFVYDEAVSSGRWFALSFIWLALAMFSLESLYHHRKSQKNRARRAVN